MGAEIYLIKQNINEYYEYIIWGSMPLGTKELISAIILRIIEQQPHSFGIFSIPLSRPNIIISMGQCLT